MVIACWGLMLIPCSVSAQKIYELGKQSYSSCSLCHGLDGKGAKTDDFVMAPSLRDSDFVKKAKTSEAMVAVILKGIHKEDNKYLQMMVPLEDALDDDKLAAVATYVRQEFGGKKKELVKPGEVKKWRAKYKTQQRPWKRSELADIIKSTESKPPTLTNVEYSVYKGSWKKLPDFSTMEPVQRGELKDGTKLSLDVVKNMKDNFGVVFEGDLNIFETDTYEFSLHSDDGSALVIDGEGVINNDGIHPGVTKKGKEKLEAGSHTFKILYFEAGGGEEFGFMSKSSKTGEAQFSKQSVAKKGKSRSYDPIVLGPTETEAIVHRAFLPGSKPRAIGVGYPGGVNLVWNADTLNVDQYWRGDFVDAAPHWNGRGSGSKIIGEPGIKVATGLPFQELESLDESWVPFSEGKIKYERDKAEPQKDITFDIRHPDYQFRGYRLDKNRFPTFNYDYQGMKVTDTFTPGKDGDKDIIVRKVGISGKARENTYMRISAIGPGDPAGSPGDWIDAGDMSYKIEGAEPTYRQSGGNKEILALISGDNQITITYRWNKPRQLKVSAE